MWFCVSPLVVSPHKPWSAAMKIWIILPSTNSKLGVFLITLNITLVVLSTDHIICSKYSSACRLPSYRINTFQNTSKSTCWETFKWLVEYYISLFLLCADCWYELYFPAYFLSVHLSPVVFLRPMKCYFTNKWLSRYLNIRKFWVQFTVAFNAGWILTCNSIQNIPHFPAHKTRCDFFARNFRKKNNVECILILVIYWKKTGLLHTKIRNHNIIYSSQKPRKSSSLPLKSSSLSHDKDVV
jgi:hypothetical protein